MMKGWAAVEDLSPSEERRVRIRNLREMSTKSGERERKVVGMLTKALELREQAERTGNGLALDKAKRLEETVDRRDRVAIKRTFERWMRQESGRRTSQPVLPAAFMVKDALRMAPSLFNGDGEIDRDSVLLICKIFGMFVADIWEEHGGHELPEVVVPVVHTTFPILLETIHPHSFRWGGRRTKSYSQDLNGLVAMLDDRDRDDSVDGAVWKAATDTFANTVMKEAEPYFTQQAFATWDAHELASTLVSAIEFVHEANVDAGDENSLHFDLPASLVEWQEDHPAPTPAPYGVSDHGAELWCRDWLIHMGLHDAATTQVSGDGGVDVESGTHIVQVKNYSGSVPIAEIRELVGVAVVDGRKPVFMTSGTYPAQAEEFADRAGMALLSYNVSTGQVFPANSLGQALVTEGLLRAG